jgi:hypothetical protein
MAISFPSYQPSAISFQLKGENKLMGSALNKLAATYADFSVIRLLTADC